MNLHCLGLHIHIITVRESRQTLPRPWCHQTPTLSSLAPPKLIHSCCDRRLGQSPRTQTPRSSVDRSSQKYVHPGEVLPYPRRAFARQTTNIALQLQMVVSS